MHSRVEAEPSRPTSCREDGAAVEFVDWPGTCWCSRARAVWELADWGLRDGKRTVESCFGQCHMIVALGEKLGVEGRGLLGAN